MGPPREASRTCDWTTDCAAIDRRHCRMPVPHPKAFLHPDDEGQPSACSAAYEDGREVERSGRDDERRRTSLLLYASLIAPCGAASDDPSTCSTHRMMTTNGSPDHAWEFARIGPDPVNQAPHPRAAGRVDTRSLAPWGADTHTRRLFSPVPSDLHISQGHSLCNGRCAGTCMGAYDGKCASTYNEVRTGRCGGECS